MPLKLHIVLHCPEIPQNTGNISRTCAVTGASLHLIRPLGFEVTDARLKRAGLDYWKHLDITYYDSDTDFFAQHEHDTIYYFSTKAKHNYAEVSYPDEVYLMFGRETKGLPEDLLKEHPDTTVRIPMLPTLRSLNLSNSVAIVLYEALRQQSFPNLAAAGHLHHTKPEGPEWADYV